MSNVLHVSTQDFDQEIGNAQGVSLVDFWAEWCGPCKMIAPVVDQVAEQYNGKVKVAKVNIDESAELATKFNIMSIPTIVFFKDGQTVDKITGVTSLEVLAQKIEELLK